MRHEGLDRAHWRFAVNSHFFPAIAMTLYQYTVTVDPGTVYALKKAIDYYKRPVPGHRPYGPSVEALEAMYAALLEGATLVSSYDPDTNTITLGPDLLEPKK